jgi:hypothetical protein
MGKITINLPPDINRRYQLNNAESTAKPIEENQDTPTAEDLADARAARRARKGDLISWEDAKAYLDTLD